MDVLRSKDRLQLFASHIYNRCDYLPNANIQQKKENKVRGKEKPNSLDH